MTAPIGTIANRFSGLRELSNVTNTYGGYFRSSGDPTELVLPWQADKLELYNYTTGANPIVWFRDMAAGTALGASAGSGSSYGYVYTLTQAGTVAIGGDVIWNDAIGAASGVSVDVGTGNITVTNAGTYAIQFQLAGTEANQFAITVNGVVQPSAIYASGAGTQQTTGEAILVLPAGAVITLRNNLSTAAVTLAPTVGGTANQAMASVAIKSVAALGGSVILTNGVTIDNLLGGFTNEHLVISGITTATPGVVTTTTNHNLSNNDRVVITKVIGTMAAQINNYTYVVQVLSPTTFALYDIFGIPVTILGAYTSSGQVTKIGPLLGDVTQPISPAVQHRAIIDYPPVYRLLLGSSVIGASNDLIFFEATMMNAYFNLGNLV